MLCLTPPRGRARSRCQTGSLSDLAAPVSDSSFTRRSAAPIGRPFPAVGAVSAPSCRVVRVSHLHIDEEVLVSDEVLDPEEEEQDDDPLLDPDDEPEIEPDALPDDEPVTAPEPDTLPEELHMANPT